MPFPRQVFPGSGTLWENNNDDNGDVDVWQVSQSAFNKNPHRIIVPYNKHKFI